MSALNDLKTRVKYLGGALDTERLKKGKLQSLKRAMQSSYQAAIAILEDGREFKCLINPDKISVDYDNKMISIPFVDVCLNGASRQEEEIGLRPGHTFTWKETDTHWLVYLQYLEELAYFRAAIKKCTNSIEIDGKKYWCCVKGPTERSLDWNSAEHFYWNDLNYTMVLDVPKNDATLAYFDRFQKVKINGNTWEVQATDKISVDGIIEVFLKEAFNNTIEDAAIAEAEELEEPINSRIIGKTTLSPYDVASYAIDLEDGQWALSGANGLACITKTTASTVTIEVLTGRGGGDFILSYSGSAEGDFELPIKIKSL